MRSGEDQRACHAEAARRASRVGGSNSVVESQPSKLLVAGSIPVSRSRLRSRPGGRKLRPGKPLIPLETADDIDGLNGVVGLASASGRKRKPTCPAEAASEASGQRRPM